MHPIAVTAEARVASIDGDAPRVFNINITNGDGAVSNYQRIGGSACEHLEDALELAGVGGRIEVKLAAIREGVAS